MKPRCYVCKSPNVAMVSAGLSCLDCGMDESKVVPTSCYEEKCLDLVEWDGTPHMGQRGMRAFVSLLAQANDPSHKGRETIPHGRDTKPDKDQLEMFDRNEFRVTSPQKELF